MWTSPYHSDLDMGHLLAKGFGGGIGSGGRGTREYYIDGFCSIIEHGSFVDAYLWIT